MFRSGPGDDLAYVAGTGVEDVVPFELEERAGRGYAAVDDVEGSGVEVEREEGGDDGCCGWAELRGLKEGKRGRWRRSVSGNEMIGEVQDETHFENGTAACGNRSNQRTEE